MKKNLTALAFLVFWVFGAACSGLKKSEKTPIFPTDWFGEWSGPLRIFRPNGSAQNVPMSLIIKDLGMEKISFNLVYGEQKEDNRPYEMRPVDASKGHWLTDEKNSILLDDFVIGGKLFSHFVVQNARLVCTYERRGDELIFEVISGKNEPIRSSGDTVFEGDTIPKVESFGVGVFQRAILKRKK